MNINLDKINKFPMMEVVQHHYIKLYNMEVLIDWMDCLQDHRRVLDRIYALPLNVSYLEVIEDITKIQGGPSSCMTTTMVEAPLWRC